MARLTFRIRAWFGAAAAALLVAACSSAPQITPSASVAGRPTSVVDPTTTAPPSLSPSTSSPSDLATRFPKTKVGAEGFVRAYLDALSQAFRSANPALIKEYVDVACTACNKWIGDITELRAKNEHLEGPLVVLVDVDEISSTASGSIVQVLIDVPRAVFVDKVGKTTGTRTAEPRAPFYFRLDFTDHWRVVKAAAA
ncbi:MAG: hypothetical protein WAW82_06810 [Candidatus Lutibacillus vidarii]|nr:hypothetical protein [Candidatus Lutibacillus vidarii]